MNKAVAMLMLIAILSALVVLTWTAFSKPQTGNTSPIYVVPTTPKPQSNGGGGGGVPVIGPTPSPTSSATDSNLLIFSDAETTHPLSNLDWGAINIGGNSNRTIYIKNEEAGAVATFLQSPTWAFFNSANEAMNTTEYEQYFNITWDRQDVVIDQHEVMGANLVLTISPDLPMYTVERFTAQLSLTYEKP